MVKMRFLKYVACAGAALMALAACEDDKHICTLPAFAGFRIEPSAQWQPGDSVTITAVQSSLGDLLYKAEYHWSVVYGDTTFTRDYDVVYDAEKDDPYIGFRIPEGFTANSAEISFSVQYSYSATAPASAPSRGQGGGDLVGTITTSSASQLYGRGSGSYTLNWH